MPVQSQHLEPPLVLPAELEKAYASRDILTVSWDFAHQLRRDPDFAKYASAFASLMRVILTKGEEPQDRAEAIAETAVIGSVLHGIRPRDEEQWKIAEKFFDEATLEDLRHWTPVQGSFGHPAAPEGQELCECGCFWRRDPGTRPVAATSSPLSIDDGEPGVRS